VLCKQKDELLEAVQRHLARLSELAHLEITAIQSKSDNTWLNIDKEIENTIGEKERALGALKQHQQEHGC
jgi:hypothetical protein